MRLRSSWARIRLGAVGLAAALVCGAGARADVLHATYRVSLIGLPIGAVNLNADLSPTSYSIQGDAKLTGLAITDDIVGTKRPQHGSGKDAGKTGDGSDWDIGAYEYVPSSSK